MYYATGRKREGLKAVMSLAAIAAGLVLSNMATPSMLTFGGESLDVVGVWRFVEPAPTGTGGATPLFEIRRAADGHLEAQILVRSGARVGAADVSFDAGHLCMVTEHGASFKGEISDDGTTIEGVIHFHGGRSSASLQRVDRRKVRRADERRSYAT